MPPKKADKKAEKGQIKALEKQKLRVVEEKTFGLKNRNKSKTVQKYIKGIQSNVKFKNVSEQALIEKEFQQKEEKKKKLQQAALLESLFKGTENIKKIDIDKSKTDLTPAALKAQQHLDIYIDQREQRSGLKVEVRSDAIHSLDEKKKQGVDCFKVRDIVCKYFVEALEKKQYGWFWECPNGGDKCLYRHCLPPGYILKTDAPNEVFEEEEELSLEDKIDQKRQALGDNGTKVTWDTFSAWKQKKNSATTTQDVVDRSRHQPISGRDLFALDPAIFIDDAGAVADQEYTLYLDDTEINNDSSEESGKEHSDDLQKPNQMSYDDTTQDKEMSTIKDMIGQQNIFLSEDLAHNVNQESSTTDNKVDKR